ncbi:hypothetical protein HPP92_026666 [Vanilla planifolia]|uniref:Late embryogenesis abundant protein LEA-2 subgroup domain-containing protein n=1 Tax=Vanilla planifolia TaxID=51239 RepID=A0A835U5R0_VANPL|nr:hypothetical protein HPP92_026893 [Vanilla planifolia]KAG0450594.1 hypothetical protein HPP92_026666 [Vanilla planifolia]KAG0498805.1 hypothetical protein HPP92_003496 [Vanilla planifolia]
MAIHTKTDSDLTSLAASSPPRSPRRPVYYVMSPSHPDAEKISLGGLSPGGSPIHHHHHPSHHRYSSSPIHHSRESSTTRFSASLKNGYWRKVPQDMHRSGCSSAGDDEIDEEDRHDERWGFRCYAVMFVLGFFFLFSLFSLILWGASKAYRPKLTIKSLVFERYNIQAGMDITGVPTKMISINSTVKMWFRNPATFFGVQVSATPLALYYYDLRIASGQIVEFYEPRKSERVVTTTVVGEQVPLYGGGASLTSRNNGDSPAVVPLELNFVVRARANVLGKLVRTKFYRAVRCAVYLRESRLGRPVDLRGACEYE